MSTRALIVVDIQNDYFPGGNWPLVGADAAADNAARVIQAARDAGDFIVYIRHEAASADAPFFAPGSDGAQLHTKVQNLEHDPVVLKHFPNSFRETGLQALLKDKGIEQLVIIGSMSHMCIDATTRAAADFGYKVKVIHDACASRDLEFDGSVVPAAQVHAAFMSALGFGYAEVISTQTHLG